MTSTTDLPENPWVASMGHNQAPPTDTRSCVECGGLFEAHSIGPGMNKRFCCRAHAKAWNNRNTAQGGPLVPLLKAWRASRNGSAEAREVGAAALSEVCAILDNMLWLDRKQGRSTKSVIEYARISLADSRYIDRQR